MDGVVASPHEVALIREACGRDFLVVTPGIRPAGARERRPGARGDARGGARGGRRLPRRGPADHRGRRPGRGRRPHRAARWSSAGRDRLTAPPGLGSGRLPEPLGPGRLRVVGAQARAPDRGPGRVARRLACERSREERLRPIRTRAGVDHLAEGLGGEPWMLRPQQRLAAQAGELAAALVVARRPLERVACVLRRVFPAILGIGARRRARRARAAPRRAGARAASRSAARAASDQERQERAAPARRAEANETRGLRPAAAPASPGRGLPRSGAGPPARGRARASPGRRSGRGDRPRCGPRT